MSYTLTPDEKKTIDDFITKMMPYIRANNAPENIEYVMRKEAMKFYTDAFYHGTMDVLEEK